MSSTEVTLPGGVVVDGSRHRTAHLRPLSGQDEAILLEEAQSLPPASLVTSLLFRCLDGLGPLRPVTRQSVRELTLGDREALLLNLRRLTLGDRMSCVLTCPNQACGEKMDLDLNVSDLLVQPYQYEETQHETVVLLKGKGRYRICFRLPNGADQEAAALLARESPKAAVNAILQRCIAGMSTENGRTRPLKAIPATVAAALSQVMADLDPQAEILLNLTCPSCGAAFVLPFDAGDYFCQEILGRKSDLYREVHLLAFYYHWSEAEILDMAVQKRRLYLDLIAEAVSARRGG